MWKYVFHAVHGSSCLSEMDSKTTNTHSRQPQGAAQLRYLVLSHRHGFHQSRTIRVINIVLAFQRILHVTQRHHPRRDTTCTYVFSCEGTKEGSRASKERATDGVGSRKLPTSRGNYPRKYELCTLCYGTRRRAPVWTLPEIRFRLRVFVKVVDLLES